MVCVLLLPHPINPWLCSRQASLGLALWGSRNTCWNREDKLGWQHSSLWAFKCLWNDLPTSAFQCCCCFQEPAGLSKDKAHPEQWEPHKAPYAGLKCPIERPRMLCSSQPPWRAPVLVLGLTEWGTLGVWITLRGLDYFGLHGRIFSYFCNSRESKLQGSPQCNLGVISASSYLARNSFPTANTTHS